MTNSPSNRAPIALDPTALHKDANWLNAEIEATSSEGTRALLLYEAGHLSEVAANATDSARLFLQAVNTDSRFSEPVERLLALFEQRHSMKNVGRIVERLGLLAETTEQRERSALEHASYALIVQDDANTTRQVLLELVEVVPTSVGAWNLLNCIAEQTSDFELMQNALKSRAMLSKDLAWSGVLLMELAEVQRKLGRFDDAMESLDQVIEASGPLTFAALELLQRMAFAQRNYEALSRAHMGQASLLERAIGDTSAGDTLGVPHWRRSQNHVADELLRAALARHTSGNIGEAATLLEKARALCPEDPLLQHVVMLCAKELGDFDLAIAQARAVASRTTGNAAAAAWLRVALFELSHNQEPQALLSIASGLENAATSIALHGLRLHVLASDYHQSQYSTALQACADLMASDASKARCLLAAADAWARNSNDVASAKAALSQAALLGSPPSVVNHLARLLAIELGDVSWYDEATRRLACFSDNTEERTELWLELLRLRIIKNQLGRIPNVLQGLQSNESGYWLASVFESLWLPPGASEGDDANAASPPSLVPSSIQNSIAESPLKRCARRCSNDRYRQAYEIADVSRALRTGHRDTAMSDLQSMAERDPSNILAALALTNLQLAKGSTAAAIDQMCSAANAIENESIAAMLAVKATLLAARINDADRYLASSDRARSRAPAVAAAVEGWLGRILQPDDDPVTSPTPLASSFPMSSRRALESFAREVRRQNYAAAGAAIDQASIDDSSLGIAVAIAKLLLDSATSPEAIDKIASLLPAFEPISGALRVRYILGNDSSPSPEHVDAAQRWCQVDSDISAALEFLVAARAEGKIDTERAAWQTLASRSSGRLKTQIDLAQARFNLFGDAALPALLSAQSVEAKLLNLESSRPGCDPRRRSRSLEDVQPLLDDSDKRVSAILVAYNSLAAGFTEQALDQFKNVVAKDARSVSAWEGLRLAAELCDDFVWVVNASEALGKCMGDAKAAAELYEHAAGICFNTLHDAARGERLLTLAVASDISRYSAFDRLFRRVRDRNDWPRLLELIDLRLNISDDVDELVKLHWERARVLRSLGDREAALQALENVTLLEPEHIGALALAAEMAISDHQLPEAAKYLDQLARLESAPGKQRLMSAIAAADLYESKLKQPQLAVSLLLMLTQAGLGTIAVRERLARCAAQAENWVLASEVSLGLASDRDERAGRVEAARLSMSICREKLASPTAALPAVQRILSEIPADLEAIDFLLEQPFSDEHNRQLCAQATESLRLHLGEQPLDAESIDRLAQLAALTDDTPLRQVALGALAALGAGAPEMADELAALDSRVARSPSIALDEACFTELSDVDAHGPIAELFRHLAPWYNEALGPSLAVLKVTKKNRMDPRAGLPLRNEIAAWAGALGLGEFDLYIGGVGTDDVVGVPGEIPGLVVGTALRAPLSAHHRQLVARELYAIRQGTSILRHRSPTEIAALIVATCRLADTTVASPAYAMVDEFTRLLSSTLSRRVRKLLPGLCSPLAQSNIDPLDWYAGAIASRDRMAALAAGDVSLVVGRDAPLGTVDNTVTLNDRRKRLLPFVFTPQYLSLRERLGVGVK